MLCLVRCMICPLGPHRTIVVMGQELAKSSAVGCDTAVMIKGSGHNISNNLALGASKIVASAGFDQDLPASFEVLQDGNLLQASTPLLSAMACMMRPLKCLQVPLQHKVLPPNSPLA